MKPVKDWIEADLHELVAIGAREGLRLDFKRSVALLAGEPFKNAISKDVAAFANADGGILVYGVVERDFIAAEVDDGIAPGTMTAERLTDIVVGNTDPPVDGVQVHRIGMASGNETYVVGVPAATTRAPHQANDKRYYRRFEAKNQPMADHEVRDLLRRGSTPAPRLVFRIVGNLIDGLSAFNLQVSITNDSTEPMTHGVIEILIDERLMNSAEETASFGTLARQGEVMADASGEIVKLVKFSQNHMPPGYMPIFKEYQFLLAESPASGYADRDYILGYQVFCPGAQFKKLELKSLRRWQIEGAN